ncbi:hypothetical protein PAHAL_2G254700 [Panicum hallii]|uniref:Uncharacterized protein n=1 Tax=Panicum hallii TaxID=206008 RepID=A0A2T8KQE6_9POAL|nr:hypothetical protein PAHAL_2G254700 [Panicum hallii]
MWGQGQIHLSTPQLTAHGWKSPRRRPRRRRRSPRRRLRRRPQCSGEGGGEGAAAAARAQATPRVRRDARQRPLGGREHGRGRVRLA